MKFGMKTKLKEKYQGQDNREMEKADQTRDNSLGMEEGEWGVCIPRGSCITKVLQKDHI